MDSLRWILLIAGLGLIAGVYFFGHPSRSAARKERKAQRQKNVLPFDIDEDSESGDDDVDEGEEFNEELNSLSRLIRDDVGEPVAKSRGASDEHGSDDDSQPDSSESVEDRLPENPDRIVVLNVRAREGNINGARLFEAMSKAGLELGPRKVFHRFHDGPDGPVPLFTVANMLKPGTFETPEPSALTTPGVALFMTLPGVMSALDIWDSMLATGNRLAELLDAELLDESFSTMGRQRSSHIREQMREYDRATEFRAQLHSPEGLR